MPRTVLSISAVDPATDQLTIVGHGLTTGDTFLTVYSPDDGAIPGGLADATYYWAIRGDADHVKLASSSANAVAGVALDITSAGSGTLQLLKGLPYGVPRISTPLSQIKSDDFNMEWEALVALWRFLTGQAQSIFAGIKLALNQNLRLQGSGYIQHDTELDLIPFTPGGDWQVAAGAPPAWRVAGGLPSVNVSASSSVYYPLKIGTNKKRLQGVIVYGRAFVGPATLSLYVSSGMNSGAESLNVLTLAGGGTTLAVPADGLYNPRTLTLQAPLQPTAGEMLLLRVDTAAGDNMDVITYGVERDAP